MSSDLKAPDAPDAHAHTVIATAVRRTSISFSRATDMSDAEPSALEEDPGDGDDDSDDGVSLNMPRSPKRRSVERMSADPDWSHNKVGLFLALIWSVALTSSACDVVEYVTVTCDPLSLPNSQAECLLLRVWC